MLIILLWYLLTHMLHPALTFSEPWENSHPLNPECYTDCIILVSLLSGYWILVRFKQ